jgi:hypothetical protein
MSEFSQARIKSFHFKNSQFLEVMSRREGVSWQNSPFNGKIETPKPRSYSLPLQFPKILLKFI